MKTRSLRKALSIAHRAPLAGLVVDGSHPNTLRGYLATRMTCFCRAMMAGAFGMALREGRESALTSREQEVTPSVAEGLTNQEIAKRLFLSEWTADGHLEQIREKLGVNSRAQIAAWVAQRSQAASIATAVPSRMPAFGGSENVASRRSASTTSAGGRILEPP